MNPVEVILDTNIIIAGTRSRNGASFQVLSEIANKRFKFLASVPLFLEYEAILKRPEQRAVHGLSLADIDCLLNVWARYCCPVPLYYLWRPQLRDPQDEMVLETAVNGAAQAIVTLDRADFEPVVERFSIALWSPAILLKKIRNNP